MLESMVAVVKWTSLLLLLALLLLAVGAAALVFLLNAGRLTAPMENSISGALERDFSIQGDMHVSIFPKPRMTVTGARLGNAAWSDYPVMAEAAHVTFQMQPAALLRGQLVFAYITMEGVRLLLERSATGAENWEFPGEDGDLERLAVQWLQITDGVLLYRDAAAGITENIALGQVTSDFNPASGQLAMRAHGSRRAEDTFNASLNTTLGRPRMQGALVFELTSDPIAIRVDGAVANPWTLDDLDARLVVNGHDPGRLLPWGDAFPVPALPYSLVGFVRRNGAMWSLDGFHGRLGESELAGNLAVLQGASRPLLRVDLHAPVLDLVQLLQGREEEEDAAIIPLGDFNADWFQSLDADVRFSADTLHVSELTLSSLVLDLSLRAGYLRILPFTAELLEGRVSGALDLRADQVTPEADLELDLDSIALGEMLIALGLDIQGFGSLDGQLDVSATGESLRALLTSINGEGSFLMMDGHLDDYFLTLARQDMSSVIAFLTGEDEGVAKTRCVIADFEAVDGLIFLERLIIDAPELKIVSEGSLSLETLALDFRFLPRNADFSLDPGRDVVRLQGIRGEVEVDTEGVKPDGDLKTPVLLDVAPDADCPALAEAIRAVL